MLASMMSETLSRTDLLLFPLVTVVLFVAMFAGAVLWICRRGAREIYADRSRLVFDDATGRPGPEAPSSGKECNHG